MVKAFFFFSFFFPMMGGTRQGDPVSCYIYLLCGPILNMLIHQNECIKGISLNGKEYLIRHFAEDTELILDGRDESLRAAIQVLETFYKNFGSKSKY